MDGSVFANVKLKHVERVSTPTAASKHEENEQLLLIQQRVRECDLEAWYPRLEQWTFPTTVVPISIGFAKRMVSGIRTRKTQDIISEKSEEMEALQRAIGAFGTSFVKLSSRSPKDATVAGERTRKIFNEELAKSTEKDANAVFICLNLAHIKALAVESAHEALSLLLASERVLDDLELALEDVANWSQHFVIRKWVTLPLSGEFRGFVCNGRLTALSQYFAPCFFSELQGKEREVASKCEALLAEISHLLPKNVVCDFAVLPDRVLVIELNPFNDYLGCGTSSCMFDWKADRAVLDGNAPFEIRIVKEKHPNIKSLVGNEWRNFF